MSSAHKQGRGYAPRPHKVNAWLSAASDITLPLIVPAITVALSTTNNVAKLAQGLDCASGICAVTVDTSYVTLLYESQMIYDSWPIRP